LAISWIEEFEMKLLVIALVSIFPGEALASRYVIACGEGREKGPESAEVAFVDDHESVMKFYLRGENLSDDSYDIASRNGAWLVTVYGGPGRKDRKFVFHEAKKTVQEYLLEDAGEKAVGREKPCQISGT
jgi:hypothetical protein